MCNYVPGGTGNHDFGSNEMQITIVGTGNMARGIATRALAGGHDVTLIGTDRSKAEALAGELGGAGGGSVQAGDTVAGDAVVLAVPYPAAAAVLDAHAGDLAGKVVVDITNPVDFETFEPLSFGAGSGAQEIANAAPKGAKVVKAFNTTFAGTLVEGAVAGQPLDVFIAGDDDGAKATVRRLVEDGGLRAIDAGPLRRARELEALGYLHMAVQQPLDSGFSSTVKVLA
jgi:predicted dinucleotide-binding enzyme